MLRITKMGFAKMLIRNSGRCQIGGVVSNIGTTSLYTYARFATLEMTALDDPDFEAQFRTEIITSVAQAANVNEDDVTIDGFSAGSVVVEMTIKFASSAYAAKTALQELVTNTPEAVFG